MKKFIYGVVFVSALLLTGCADAGKDQSVVSSDVVTLDGSASKADFFGEIKKYRWKQVKGSKVSLSDFKVIKPTFTAPSVSKKTTLTFRLVTKEMGGYYSPWKTKDEVTIVINPASSENKLPQALATVSSETIKYGQSVTFDASTSTDSDGEIVSYEWTDAQGGTLGSGVTLAHVFDTLGTHTVTLTVTDNEGATSTTSVTVTVNALQKPQADINASVTVVRINDTVTFDANGSSDSDGEIISYAWTDAQGNVLSDMVSFTHTFMTSGEHNITLSVMDDDEQIATSTVSITVQALLLSVSLSSLDASLEVNASTELNATAHYNDNTTVPVSSSAEWIVGDTSIVTIDANGTLKALQSGTTSIMVKVGEIESNVISIEVIPQDTIAPTLILNGEAELTLELGTAYTELGATATDDRDENVSMTQTGLVDTNIVGTYSITYTATDKAGNSASIQRTVHVVLPPDVTAPILTLNGESAMTLYQGENYIELGATANDERDGNVSVAISGNVDTSVVGQYTVTYTAIDSAGNSTTLTRTVNIVDVTPPVLTLNGESSITLEQNAVYTELGATALDAVDGNVSVLITGDVDTTTVGTYMITYTTRDSAGNESNSTRTIIVIDVTPPVLTLNGEANITLEQNAIYNELGATALDAVDGNVSVYISSNVDTSMVGNYIITYSAVDNASNEANITRSVTVIDVTPPVITLNGEVNITLEQNANYIELGASAIDVVDGNISVIISGSVDTSRVGTYTITYTAQDSAGNEANTTRSITVIDVIPPIITLNGEANLTLEYGDVYEELGATAIDNSDGNVSVEISGTVDTSVEGSYTVTYTATDSSGNSATATRTVTIEKRIEPPSIVISDELNSTLSENTIPYNRMTLEIPTTSTQTLTAINQTLSQEQNRTIRVKGIDNNGTFYLYNIPLIKGTNKIELHAINEIDEEVIQSITINADANQTVPIGMRATKYEGIQSLQTEVEVGTALDIQEYLFDSNGDGIIDESSAEGNFTVNFTEEGRYKPRVTIRTQNDLLYSSGSYALSLDVRVDENQTDPVGAEPIDVAKEFVEALIADDREKVEHLVGYTQDLLDFIYGDNNALERAKGLLLTIDSNSWTQEYRSNGSVEVRVDAYDSQIGKFPIVFEVMHAYGDDAGGGRMLYVSDLH